MTLSFMEVDKKSKPCYNKHINIQRDSKFGGRRSCNGGDLSFMHI
jgi:hypothetical protein